MECANASRGLSRASGARRPPRSCGTVLMSVLTLAAGPASARAAQSRLPYLDSTLPVERRIDDLLARMTLQEKVGQMLCLWQGKRAITDSAGHFDPACARLVSDRYRTERAARQRPRRPRPGGVHERDSALGKRARAPRHSRPVSRGGAARARGESRQNGVDLQGRPVPPARVTPSRSRDPR